MTTDLWDKTVEDWVDHLGQHHNAGCDGDHGTLSCCNQHNLIEVLERRLAEAEQKIAERDVMLAQCVLIGRNILLALTPDLPKDKRPTFEEFSNSIQSLPASAKANAEVLRAARKLGEFLLALTTEGPETLQDLYDLETELQEAVRAAKESK